MKLKKKERHHSSKMRGQKRLSILLTALLCASQAGMTLTSFADADNSTILDTATQSGAYSGYIFKIKDDAVSEYSYKEDIALYDASAGSEDSSDTGIKRLYDADGLYRAADLDDIKDFVDEDDIEYVEPDYIRHMYDDVSESGGPEMTADVAKPQPGSNNAHLELMKVPAAWEYGLRGEDTDMSLDMSGNGDGKDPIVIGVIDSGLAEGHEDIDYTHVLPGANFASSSGGSTADTQFSFEELVKTLSVLSHIDAVCRRSEYPYAMLIEMLRELDRSLSAERYYYSVRLFSRDYIHYVFVCERLEVKSVCCIEVCRYSFRVIVYDNYFIACSLERPYTLY